MRLRAALAASVAVVLAVGLFAPVHAATGTSVASAVVTGSGLGFDACEAPSSAVLRAWSASPYTSVNVYFGGSQRACADQPQLSGDWVTTALSNGWSLIPTYVDLQAPCNTGSKQKMNPATAATDGATAANDAINGLSALGLNKTVAYLDLEPFDAAAGDPCASTVVAYTDAWTQTLHANGFRSGVY